MCVRACVRACVCAGVCAGVWVWVYAGMFVFDKYTSHRNGLAIIKHELYRCKI